MSRHRNPPPTAPVGLPSPDRERQSWKPGCVLRIPSQPQGECQSMIFAELFGETAQWGNGDTQTFFTPPSKCAMPSSVCPDPPARSVVRVRFQRLAWVCSFSSQTKARRMSSVTSAVWLSRSGNSYRFAGRMGKHACLKKELLVADLVSRTCGDTGFARCAAGDEVERFDGNTPIKSRTFKLGNCASLLRARGRIFRSIRAACSPRGGVFDRDGQ